MQVYMFVSVCQACTFIMDISIIIKFEEACIESNWLCIEKMNKPESPNIIFVVKSTFLILEYNLKMYFFHFHSSFHSESAFT